MKKDFNFIPEIQADWAGISRLIVRINCILFALIACILIDLILGA